MTDMENKWYIVRDMGLVCNQAFLDEVDKAIIEETKKKDRTMTDWKITSPREEDHASLRLSLLPKENGLNKAVSDTALHLVLKSKWFDMTASRVKKEEYRRICDYWKKRIWDRRTEISEVVLHKGYTNTTVSMAVKEIVTDTGNPEWGAEPGVEYYVIRYR